MNERGLEHLADDGGPCPHHAAPSVDVLVALALLGSRHSGFNHDLASKLQGILMSLDELIESPTVASDPELRRATESALTSVQELHTILNANRALGRTAVPSRASVRELVQQAGERAGVAIRGAVIDAPVEAAVPSLVQALALAIDACAGPGRGRSLDVSGSVTKGRIELALAVVLPAPPNHNELVALAVSVIRREGGSLVCTRTGDRMVIRLPVAG